MPTTPNALDDFHLLPLHLSNKRLAVFLDYDGTLTPIVERPELAILSNAMRGAVEALGRRVPTAIVSGRALQDVMTLVRIETLYYAGNHGFEVQIPGEPNRLEFGGEHLEPIRLAAGDVEKQVASIDGVFVENKGYTFSVHTRLTPSEQVPVVEAQVKRVLGRFPTLRMHLGKQVFEVRPAVAWNKGRAVLWLLEALHLDGPDVLPIYLGDDETDEDAFRALASRGIGIVVASSARPTAATYRLRDVDETRMFIDRLARAVEP